MVMSHKYINRGALGRGSYVIPLSYIVYSTNQRWKSKGELEKKLHCLGLVLSYRYYLLRHRVGRYIHAYALMTFSELRRRGKCVSRTTKLERVVQPTDRDRSGMNERRGKMYVLALKGESHHIVGNKNRWGWFLGSSGV